METLKKYPVWIVIGIVAIATMLNAWFLYSLSKRVVTIDLMAGTRVALLEEYLNTVTNKQYEAFVKQLQANQK